MTEPTTQVDLLDCIELTNLKEACNELELFIEKVEILVTQLENQK